MSIGIEKRLLGGVLREVEVSKDRIGITDGHVLEASHQLREMLRLAPLDAAHHFSESRLGRGPLFHRSVSG
jgi:hypothetical protein